MRLKEFINEMTVGAALELFSLDIQQLDKETVNRQYKKLSIQHHPDKGGDIEMMKQVNDAKDTLDKALKTGITKANAGREMWDKIHKEYKILGARIKDALINAFDPNVFINYLNSFSPRKFEFKMTNTWPKPTDYSPSFAGFQGEFFTPNRNIVFTIGVTANLIDLKHSTGLAHGDLDYKVMIDGYGFAFNKKQKLSKANWRFTNDHSFFNNPEKVYPKAKLNKIFSGETSKRAFKKRDMETALMKKLKATFGSGDYVSIPLGEDFKLVIYRSTFGKAASWSVNGVYKQHSRETNGPYVSFMEEEETIEIFYKIQQEVMKVKGDKKIKRASELIKHAYDAYKKSKGL